METIDILCQKRCLRQLTSANKTIVCWNTGYILNFSFDEEWDDQKTVKVVNDKGNTICDIMFTGNSVELPKIQNTSYIGIGVYAGDLASTTPLILSCKKSILDYEGMPEPPTESVYNQIINELKNKAPIDHTHNEYITESEFTAVTKQLEQHDTDIYDINQTLDTELPSKVDKTYVDERVSEETAIIKSDIDGIQKQIHEEAHFKGYLSTNAKIQALEATPNDFAYSAESGTKWVYDEENGWQDTGVPVPDQLTPASDATPLMNGTASAGQEASYARGDHRHPTDTTRVSVTEFNQFKSDIATDMADGLDTKQDKELQWTLIYEETLEEDRGSATSGDYGFGLNFTGKKNESASPKNPTTCIYPDSTKLVGLRIAMVVPKEKSIGGGALLTLRNNSTWAQNYTLSTYNADTAQTKIINADWIIEHGVSESKCWIRTGASVAGVTRMYCMTAGDITDGFFRATYFRSIQYRHNIPAGTIIRVWGLIKE